MNDKLTRTTMRIDITPELQVGNIVVCEVDPRSGGGGGGGGQAKVKGGVITLKKKNSYELEFRIIDGDPPSPQGLEFQAVGDDAFWCDTGTCPTSMGNGSGGVLSSPSVKNSGSTLTVNADPGSTPEIYFYRLNFTNGGYCDPIIIHD